MTAKKSAKTFMGIMFIVMAVIALASALIIFFSDYTYYSSGIYVSYEYYGGDAYTGIQNAAADTANNVGRLISNTAELEELAQTAVALFFVILTLLFVTFGIKNLMEAKTNPVPVAAENAPQPAAEEKKPEGNEGLVEQLQKYKKLLDEGVISEADYENAKKRILGEN